MASDKEMCTILIPVRNNAKVLRTCLQSVLRGSVVPEIIVLDNGSTDETKALLQQDFPQVRHVQIGMNTGRCHALNTGIHLTRTPCFMTLSPFVRVGRHTVERLLAAADRHPKAYAVQARVMDSSDKEQILSTGIEMDAMGKVSRRFTGMRCGASDSHGAYRAPAKILAAGLEASLFKMDCLYETGIFDERLYAVTEDLDLGMRAYRNGFYALYEPGAVVMGEDSIYELSDFYRKVQIGNIIYMLYKNMSELQYRLNAPLVKSPLRLFQARAARALGMDADELQSCVLRGRELCLNAELERLEAEQGASVTKRPLPEEFDMDVSDERLRRVYPLFLGSRLQGDYTSALPLIRLQWRLLRNLR